MKSLIVLALIFSGYLGSAQSMDHQTVVEKLFLDGWNNKDLSDIKEYIGDSVLFHLNNFHFYTSAIELEGLINDWHMAFDHLRFEIINIVSNEDIVAINLRYTGKQVGNFMGIEPKNNEISVSEMMFFRFEKGKLLEAWELYDEMGMRSQMAKDNRP